MKQPRFLFKFAVGLTALATTCLVVAATFAVSRWLGFRELHLVDEIDGDTKSVAALIQACIAGLLAAVCLAIRVYLRSRKCDENVG
jgi:ABC-type Co2+ transport system permease subunit